MIGSGVFVYLLCVKLQPRHQPHADTGAAQPLLATAGVTCSGGFPVMAHRRSTARSHRLPGQAEGWQPGGKVRRGRSHAGAHLLPNALQCLAVTGKVRMSDGFVDGHDDLQFRFRLCQIAQRFCNHRHVESRD